MRGTDGFWPGAVGILAVTFLYCQAKILNAAKGIPAWRSQGMPNLLITSGLVEGCGLLAMAACWVQLTNPIPENNPSIRFLCLASFALAMHLGFAWKRYVKTADLDGMGPLAIQGLQSATPLIHFVGHLLPIVLLGSAFILGQVHPLVYGLGGLAACAGGVMWKVLVITKVSYQQGFSLPKRPQRGSGSMAAPRRMNEPAAADAAE